MGPGPSPLPHRCCCLSPYDGRAFITSGISTNTTQHAHQYAQSRHNVSKLLKLPRCGPSAMAPSAPMLLSATPCMKSVYCHRTNHIASHDTEATVPKQAAAAQNRIVGTRQHAPPRSNTVSLSKMCRPGPSALAPSPPMLLPGHHTKHSACMHHPREPPTPTRTTKIQACNVVVLRQVWFRWRGTFLAKVVACEESHD